MPSMYAKHKTFHEKKAIKCALRQKRYICDH